MPILNRLNELPIANIDENVKNDIKNLELKMNNRYYLIAFDRSEGVPSIVDI